MAERRLTWDDEVRISDAIYAAKEVSAALDGAEPNDEQRRILDAAREATDELVLAHRPLVTSLAYSVITNSPTVPSIDMEDLIQIGMITLYSQARTFDARRRNDGLAHDTGNRFSVWASRNVKREMVRAIQRLTHATTGAMALTERTRTWLQTFNTLREQLGRNPSNDEVERVCNISHADIDLASVLPTAHFESPVSGSDADDSLTLGDVIVSNVDEPDFESEVEHHYAMALERMLRQILTDVECEAFMAYMGVGRDAPMTDSEIALQLHVTRQRARSFIDSAIARLRHPQISDRVTALARAALAEAEQEIFGHASDQGVRV